MRTTKQTERKESMYKNVINKGAIKHLETFVSHIQFKYLSNNLNLKEINTYNNTKP